MTMTTALTSLACLSMWLELPMERLTFPVAVIQRDRAGKRFHSTRRAMIRAAALVRLHFLSTCRQVAPTATGQCLTVLTANRKRQNTHPAMILALRGQHLPCLATRARPLALETRPFP